MICMEGFGVSDKVEGVVIRGDGTVETDNANCRSILAKIGYLKKLMEELENAVGGLCNDKGFE